MRRIAIWGDSITYGANDNEKGGWVNRLKVSLGDDIGIYNVGISGDRTYDVIERFEVECRKREPDVILFAIGTNDSQYAGSRDNASTSLEKFRENLQWLVDAAKEHSKQIGFIGLIGVDDSKVGIGERERCYDNENVRNYDAVVKDVCEINGLPYLYMFDLLSEREIPDGLHPGPEGHEKMFVRIEEFIGREFE